MTFSFLVSQLCRDSIKTAGINFFNQSIITLIGSHLSFVLALCLNGDCATIPYIPIISVPVDIPKPTLHPGGGLESISQVGFQ